MNHSIKESEVRHYLAALEARLAQLPTEQSEEILFGVREHIAEAMERGGQSTAEILAGLGSPDDIAAGVAAPAPSGAQPVPQYATAPRHQDSTLWVVASCILLPFGGFLAGFGWLLGVAGLWLGTRWKLWEKILGTVLIPGGVPGALLLAVLPVRQTASTGAELTTAADPLGLALPDLAFVMVLALPILVALYLMIVGLVRGPSTAAPSMRHN